MTDDVRADVTAWLDLEPRTAEWDVDCLLRRCLDALAARTREVEEMRKPAMCSVCLGRPLASGRPCICGGVGTEQAEMHGLRVRLFDVEREAEEMRNALAGLVGSSDPDELRQMEELLAVIPHPYQEATLSAVRVLRALAAQEGR